MIGQRSPDVMAKALITGSRRTIHPAGSPPGVSGRKHRTLDSPKTVGIIRAGARVLRDFLCLSVSTSGTSWLWNVNRVFSQLWNEVRVEQDRGSHVFG